MQGGRGWFLSLQSRRARQLCFWESLTDLAALAGLAAARPGFPANPSPPAESAF